ncbi:hypothetical protein JYT71_01055 [Acidimicrobiaceae bacterium AH-315-P05]|nr:hypothetical protein [Acidimicrobiaceae bacterium AH-315-P05]
MANITKRTARRLHQYLFPDETVLAALLCEPKGTLGLGSIAVALAPGVASDALAGRAAKSDISSEGNAARLPAGTFVLAITDQRVLVSKSNGLRFEDPLTSFELGSIFVGDVRVRGLGRRMRLVFVDGSAIDVDLQRGQPIELVESLLGKVVT